MYYLEVYEPKNSPGDKPLVLAHFQSNHPFLSINVGDFMNQSFWTDEGAPWTERLRVIEIEHIITKSGNDFRHQIMVFTEIEK